MEPGLYDINTDKLLLSWEQLEKEGFDVQYDYSAISEWNEHSTLSDIVCRHALLLYKYKLIIPENTREIGDYAFANCDGLNEIVLPEELEYIGDGVFFMCTNFEKFNWPKYLTTIPNRTFYNTAIDEFDFSKIQAIGENAFESCFHLKIKDFPKIIKRIGKEAFKTCVNITEFEFPNNLLCIDNGTFQSTGLRQIIVPEGVEYINSHAFEGCDELENIVLSSTIKCINCNAFALTSITNITIPKSVEYIDIDTFAGCKQLRNIFISRQTLDKNPAFEKRYVNIIVPIENALDKLLTEGNTFKQANELMSNNLQIIK